MCAWSKAVYRLRVRQAGMFDQRGRAVQPVDRTLWTGRAAGRGAVLSKVVPSSASTCRACYMVPRPPIARPVRAAAPARRPRRPGARFLSPRPPSLPLSRGRAACGTARALGARCAPGPVRSSVPPRGNRNGSERRRGVRRAVRRFGRALEPRELIVNPPTGPGPEQAQVECNHGKTVIRVDSAS